MADIDNLLSRTAPTVLGTDEVGDAMGATARLIATTSGRRRGPGRRTGAFLLGTAAAVVAGAVVLSAQQGPRPTPTISTTEVPKFTPLQLVAAKAAPTGLPLPEGVTIDDAKAFVTTLIQNHSGLQAWGAYVLDHGVLVAHEKGQVANIPHSMQESGITAAYVYYAQCQWKRTMLGKTFPIPFTFNGKQVSSFSQIVPRKLHNGDVMTETTDVPALAALMKLGDPSSWSTDGYRAPTQLPGDHEGIGTMTLTPNGQRVSYDADFAANCTNGFGTAPTASK